MSTTTTKTRVPHRCHAEGCEEKVPTKMFMCRDHWFTLPRAMRTQIWATYRVGQEITKDPSPEYLEAAKVAVEWLAEHEGRRSMGAGS